MDLVLYERIIQNLSRVIVGKGQAIELLLVALLADGHVLLEDVPGLGKTLIAKSLARSIGGSFRRIQFTPDLLPADVTGFNVYHQQTGQFVFHPGPVMSHILLADEINRTIPRTQSSLLESLEERQVTVDGKTYPLPRPFFVMATQNPIELEGTFPLPEAQLDRFLLKISLGYPKKEEEITILERFQKGDPLLEIGAVATPEAIAGLQEGRKEIHISRPILEYITEIISATRSSPFLRLGASPR
ncbi:MAG: AAA family ATPase, partial [Deltaproteobacteria bacterium]